MMDPFCDATLTSNAEHPPLALRLVPSSLATPNNPRLPKIEKEKQQLHAKSIANKFMKSSTKLPNLRFQSSQPSEADKKFKDANANVVTQKLKARQKSEGDDFTTEIQRKLKIVLEGQNSTENYLEASDSDEQFQNKIRKHKQLIKKERQKREMENESASGSQPANFPSTFSSGPEIKGESANSSHQNLQKESLQKYRNKQELMYDRRMKDYREESIGNKFLVKKKQVVLREQQSSKKTPEQHPILASNFQSSKSRPPETRTVSKKVSSKVIHSMTKDEDLFQSLHNILLDPVRKSENDIIKEKPKRTKQFLQEHLKIIENRLAEQRKEDLEMLSRLNHKKQSCRPANQTDELTLHSFGKDEYQSWRKIDASNMWLQSKKTNFDEELDRVNRYFQKSERSIQKHIENQKRLAGLMLIGKKNEEPSKIKV